LIGLKYERFKEIEIILINDCSHDNSLSIMGEYQAKDDRIK
jgi:glycosyltransferase involved in cell wall biosynthesis